jgi:hypothetical protein
MPEEPNPFNFGGDPVRDTYERILVREAKRGAFGLVVIAGLTLFLGLITFFAGYKYQTLAAFLLFAGGSVFLGVAAWAFKDPLPAVIAGVIVFIGLQVAELFIVGGVVLCPGLILASIFVDSILAGLRHRKLVRNHPR